MSNPKDGGLPPVDGSDDFEFVEGGDTDHGTTSHEHADQEEDGPAWHENDGFLRTLRLYGGILLIALFFAVFTPIGWFFAIMFGIIACVIAFGVSISGGGGHKAGHDEHDGEHGHGEHGHDAGHGNGAGLQVTEADDLGIVVPPPETHVKFGGFGLFTIREDMVLIFYNTWNQAMYPNGNGAREVLPRNIRAHVPKGKWVEVPFVCVLRGGIDMSTKLVPFAQTVKIKGGRTVDVDGTMFVRARRAGDTVNASAMKALVASFDGSKKKLCVTALQGALDKTATKFGTKNVDVQLQDATHDIQALVTSELHRYGLELENLHFDNIRDNAEQEAGEVERLRESGALQWDAQLHRFLGAVAGIAERFGGGGNQGGGGRGGGNQGGGNRGGSGQNGGGRGGGGNNNGGTP